jgi:hypothetical protein
VLRISQTDFIVKWILFHIYAERARDSDGVVARFDRPLTKTLLVKTASGHQIISSDRVTRAPAPQDLPLEFQLDSHTTGAPEDVGPTKETVVDRIWRMV